MAKLRDEAMGYEPKKAKNIADLDNINLDDFEVEDRTFEKEGEESFSFKVIVVNGEDYRIPASVLKSLKAILQVKPDMKTFQVTKEGEGMNTSYQVIPLD